MSNLIKVGMADYKVGKSPDKLLTLGLGSCIGITLYDRAKKIGGMAHIMLPKNNNPEQRSLKFADVAIEEMLKELINMGANVKSMEAKIAGGAQMFSFNKENFKKSIGYRNSESVRKILKELDFRILSEDTGGSFGRTIELSLEEGNLKIKTMGHGEKYI